MAGSLKKKRARCDCGRTVRRKGGFRVVSGRLSFAEVGVSCPFCGDLVRKVCYGREEFKKER